MADVTPELVKKLRESSGAGMMDCKKALVETNGNFDEATDWLRKKGLSAAAKKSGRVASEGLVAVAVEGKIGAVIELNSETDFVSRNDKFQAAARQIAVQALKVTGDVEALKASKGATGATVADDVTNLIAAIGENMTLRRSAQLTVNNGVVASYVHSAVAPGLGKIGILVAIESTGDAAKLEALGKQIAMHIAAARPDALSTKDVSADMLERERNIFRDQAKASGKPADIIEKMVEGRIRKYYEEVVLLEQVFVIDGKTKIADFVANAAKEIGAPVAITAFSRFVLGEGVEKKENNFAEEVAAAARG
jgi:elongation factor Ts